MEYMMKTIEIPTPLVRPLNIPIDRASMIHEVWEVFVVPNEENKYVTQSVEERMLMAILRSLHDGLHAIKPCERCTT